MFFLKLSQEEAENMINQGISVMFGSTPSRFADYTYYIEDTNTSDRYWCVQNLQYKDLLYDIAGFISTYYPALNRYDFNHVGSFIKSYSLGEN